MDKATKCVVTFESEGRDFDPKAVAKILQKWVALAEEVKTEAEQRNLSFLYQRLLWLVNFKWMPGIVEPIVADVKVDLCIHNDIPWAMKFLAGVSVGPSQVYAPKASSYTRSWITISPSYYRDRHEGKNKELSVKKCARVILDALCQDLTT